MTLLKTPLDIDPEDHAQVLSPVNAKKKPVNTRLYKTNLCRTWTRQGNCPYGLKCQFAHGEHELRPVPPEEARTPSKELLPMIRSPIASPTVAEGGEVVLPISSLGKKSTLESASSPRILMLSLAASPSEKPIPAGARVDCDPKLYKTEMCRSWTSTGSCRYRDKCQFAHGIEELRVAPSTRVSVEEITVESVSEVVSPARFRFSSGCMPTSSKSVSSLRSVIKDPKVYKTELCKKFEENGSCPYGPSCQFAHGAGELRPKYSDSVRSPMEISSSSSTSISPSASTPSTSAGTVSKLYKTELCRSFTRTGYCRYGLKCQFAHGIHELRTSAQAESRPLSPVTLPSGEKDSVSVASVTIPSVEKPGLPVISLISASDSELVPGSPRRLSGSPVISSPRFKVLKIVDTSEMPSKESGTSSPRRVSALMEAFELSLPLTPTGTSAGNKATF